MNSLSAMAAASPVHLAVRSAPGPRAGRVLSLAAAAFLALTGGASAADGPRPEQDRIAADGQGRAAPLSLDLKSLDRYVTQGGDVVAGYVEAVSLDADQRTPIVMVKGYSAWIRWTAKRATDQQFADKAGWVQTIKILHREMRGKAVVIAYRDDKMGRRAESLGLVDPESELFARYAVRDGQGRILSMEGMPEPTPQSKESPGSR